MTSDQVIEIGGLLLMTTAKLAMPFLLAILAIGLLVGLFQSVTQLQEQTLTFVPKLIAVALIVVFAGNWMLSELIGFAHTMVEQIPSLLQGG